MSNNPEVAIVLARCSHAGELFGIRFERKGQAWEADWAFKVSEKIAKKERFGPVELEGHFTFAIEYPGCPYCERRCLVRCACGASNCWDGTSSKLTCRWCGNSGTVGGGVERLSADGSQ